MIHRAALDQPQLQLACAGHKHIGLRVRVVNQTASTNDECHAAASDMTNAGLVVFAEQQSAGRGSQGRTWLAPPRSSLLFSMLLFPQRAIDGPEFLTAWAAVAVADVVGCHCGLAARIKWPNDVLVGGKKICGILVERRVGTVIGVGLNVLTAAGEFPDPLPATATSIAMESSETVDRTQLAAELLARLERLYDEALRLGPATICDKWEQHSLNFADVPVAAVTRSSCVVGRLLELRPDHGARLLLNDGSMQRIAPADLLRVEAAPMG